MDVILPHLQLIVDNRYLPILIQKSKFQSQNWFFSHFVNQLFSVDATMCRKSNFLLFFVHENKKNPPSKVLVKLQKFSTMTKTAKNVQTVKFQRI